MNIHSNPETISILADHYGHFDGPPWPVFVLIPLLFWVTIVTLVVIGRSRFRGHSGESTLRDNFARGEIDETEYRTRLAVLKDTRR